MQRSYSTLTKTNIMKQENVAQQLKNQICSKLSIIDTMNQEMKDNAKNRFCKTVNAYFPLKQIDSKYIITQKSEYIHLPEIKSSPSCENTNQNYLNRSFIQRYKDKNNIDSPNSSFVAINESKSFSQSQQMKSQVLHWNPYIEDDYEQHTKEINNEVDYIQQGVFCKQLSQDNKQVIEAFYRNTQDLLHIIFTSFSRNEKSLIQTKLSLLKAEFINQMNALTARLYQQTLSKIQINTNDYFELKNNLSLLCDIWKQITRNDSDIPRSTMVYTVSSISELAPINIQFSSLAADKIQLQLFQAEALKRLESVFKEQQMCMNASSNKVLQFVKFEHAYLKIIQQTSSVQVASITHQFINYIRSCSFVYIIDENAVQQTGLRIRGRIDEISEQNARKLKGIMLMLNNTMAVNSRINLLMQLELSIIEQEMNLKQLNQQYQQYSERDLEQALHQSIGVGFEYITSHVARLSSQPASKSLSLVEAPLIESYTELLLRKLQNATMEQLAAEFAALKSSYIEKLRRYFDQQLKFLQKVVFPIQFEKLSVHIQNIQNLLLEYFTTIQLQETRTFVKSVGNQPRELCASASEFVDQYYEEVKNVVVQLKEKQVGCYQTNIENIIKLEEQWKNEIEKADIRDRVVLIVIVQDLRSQQIIMSEEKSE
ncbi:Hypothetical_protein [Hexamita inflata]|uniref:Hypothetical_protein n=1 Tax=Hexamita inflata TaxID=28002 RepID=A0AA86UHA9_9EUKA|nr:Hypothetical protein HINF_LOCUS45795 [Hexamita inflata]